MQELILDQKNTRGLILVAHPDDETIWSGGAMLRFAKVTWTVFALCRKGDKDRSPKFKKVCRFYGASSIIANVEDEGKMDVKTSVPIIKKEIKKILKARKFDYLLTHGANGEYGHLRHIGVHQATKELLKEKELIASNVFHFCGSQAAKRTCPKGYPVPSGGGVVHFCGSQAAKRTCPEGDIPPQFRRNWGGIVHFAYQGKNCADNSNLLNDFSQAKFFLKLTKQEIEAKQKIIHALYGFSKNSFEYLSCLKTETFHS